MGNCHVGFSMEGAKNEIYAVENSFLGKYLHRYIIIN